MLISQSFYDFLNSDPTIPPLNNDIAILIQNAEPSLGS